MHPSYQTLQKLLAEQAAQLKQMNKQLQAEVAAKEAAQDALQKCRKRLAQEAISSNRGNWELEKKLSQSETRYHDLYNKIPAMLHSINRHGRLISVSDYWLETLGYTRSEVIGRYSVEFLTAASRRYAEEEALPQFFQTGICRDISYQMVKKDGEVIDVLLSAVAERDQSGQIVRTLAVAVDITERKRWEEYFRAFMDRNPAMAFIKNSAGRYLYGNQAWANQFNLPLSEVLAKSDAELFSPTAVQRIRANDAVVLSRGETLKVLETERAQQLRYWTAVKFPLPNSKQPLIGGFALDISEQQRSEQELRVRVRQQAAVAQLGLQALETELPELMNHATVLLAQVLEVEYTKVLELLGGRTALRLKAGVGWKQGLVGVAMFSAERDSQAGYTLVSAQPVVVEDLRQETRFSGPPLLTAHGVVSGMSVVICGTAQPYGVLGVHTAKQRQFSQHDVNFLQAVANILATAVERQQAEKALKESEQRFRLLVEKVKDYAIFMLAPDGRVMSWNAGAEKIKGYRAQEILGQHFRRFYTHQDKQQGIPEQVLRTAEKEGQFEYEGWRLRKDGSLFWADMAITAIRDEGGQLRGFTKVTRDITERKRTEEALRRQAKALQKFSTNLKHLHRISTAKHQDLAALFSDYLGAGCAILGLTTGIVSEISEHHYIIRAVQSPFDLSPGQVFALKDTYCVSVIQKKRTITYTHVSQEPQMQSHPVYQTLQLESYLGTPILVNGNIYGTLSFSSTVPRDHDFPPYEQEIIELMAESMGRFIATHQADQKRKQAEETLRQSEIRYRGIVEAQTELICRIRPDGAFTYLNDTYCRYFGEQRDHLLGCSYLAKVCKQDRDRVKQHLASLSRQRSTGTIEYCVMQNGQRRWQQWSNQAIYNRLGLVEFQCVGRDITPRKEAETALRKSEELYRTLASNFPNGAVFLFDSRMRYTLAAGTGLADLGWQESLEGGLVEEALPVGLYRAQEFAYRAALRGEASVFELPYQNKTYLVHVLPVNNEQGEIFAGMAMMQDISDRKRTAAMQLALEREQELNQLQLRFFSMVSHEFRTPLSTILMSTQILEHSNEHWLNPKILRNLRRIQTSVKHTLGLLEDILTINRAKTGKLEFRPQPLNLEQFCNQLIEQLAFDNGPAIVFTLECQTAIVTIDEKLLHCVLSNLLSNAVKYSPQRSTITLTARCSPISVSFRVQDEGIGIPPEDLAKLFEPFHRGSNVGTVAGSGLGLTVLKQCVDLYGGQVSVDSQVGRGTVLTVTLPVGERDKGKGEIVPPGRERGKGN
ncbi:MAG: PAS domain S-box protein [Cyanophyceae cyanobacterium]